MDVRVREDGGIRAHRDDFDVAQQRGHRAQVPRDLLAIAAADEIFGAFEPARGIARRSGLREHALSDLARVLVDLDGGARRKRQPDAARSHRRQQEIGP